MDKDQQMRPRVEISRGAAMSVREIAKLRARRAARLSAEAAAGRRRLVISALCALVTVVVGGLAATSILQWTWIALPAAALAASLVASRMAAVRSERVGDEELALLASLKNGAAPAVRAEKTPSIHREEEAVDVVMAPAYEAEAESGPMRIDLSALAAAAGAEAPADAETDLESAIDTAPVERRTWTVASVPAPTYAMRGRVSGRMVHADTDLRGIPKVAARVPARPIEAVGDSREARSTDEVVADQIISLDLDAVLDARRAL